MIDVAEYCRQVEDHLTRVNGGHLVRVVGPGFELVRRWADEAIPLSVVFRGIELKADRHRSGRSTRPLRIEFCEPDVRTLFEDWRRAVGVAAQGNETAGQAVSDDGKDSRRRRSLSKHLERAIERLGRVVGRLDYPESFRDAVSGILDQLTVVRESGRTARGEARHDLITQLGQIDRQMINAARGAASADLLRGLVREAEGDLASFRGRLSGEAWQHAIEVTVDRLLRDRYGLPTLELHE